MSVQFIPIQSSTELLVALYISCLPLFYIHKQTIILLFNACFFTTNQRFINRRHWGWEVTANNILSLGSSTVDELIFLVGKKREKKNPFLHALVNICNISFCFFGIPSSKFRRSRLLKYKFILLYMKGLRFTWRK